MTPEAATIAAVDEGPTVVTSSLQLAVDLGDLSDIGELANDATFQSHLATAI